MTAIKVIGIFFLLQFAAFITSSYALGPMEALKKPVEDVLHILKDPKYKDAKKLQFEKIWKNIHDIFDFPLISKLALGKYRKSFTSQQLNELTNLFSKVLGNTYIEKIQLYTDEKIVFESQDMLSDTKAVVKTKILRDAGEIPINYRMRKKDNKWKIYDVKIEGVSLVKNYRTQFNKFLFNKTPEQLIEKLKKKIEKQKTNKKDQID